MRKHGRRSHRLVVLVSQWGQGWIFDSLLEAQVLIEDWRIDYNTNRPHSAHGDLTPTEFTKAWITRHQPALA